MKKLLYGTSIAALSLVSANEIPAQAPELPSIQQKKIDEIDKSVSIKKDKKVVIDELKVEDSAKGEGENRIKGPSFILQNVSITGNTIFDQQDIIDIVKPYVGKSVDSLDLKLISQRITILYASKGYVTSKCIIPAQKVQNGNVKFQIIEDKLGRVILKGDASYNYDSNIFMKYLGKLQGKLINANELNNQLKLLSSLPVTRIKPSLQKTNQGFTNLILEIIDIDDKFSISHDNSGSEYTGEERITLNANINNIRGVSDSLALSFTTTKDPKFLTSFSSSYVTPFGLSGGRLTFGYSHMYYQLDPEEVGSSLVIYEGDTNVFSMNYGRNIYYDNSSLSYQYGFEKKEVTSQTIENATGDVLVDGHDSLFVLNGGFNYVRADKYKGINTISLSFKKAVEGLWNSMTEEDLKRKKDDDSFPISGPIKYGDGLNPSFSKYYYSLQRDQQLPWNIKNTLKLSGNYTDDRVPDSYEYSGGDFGYAYSLGFSIKYGILSSSISATESKVYTYDENMKKSDTDDSSGKISLGIDYSGFRFYLEYLTSLEENDSNSDKYRYNIKYSW